MQTAPQLIMGLSYLCYHSTLSATSPETMLTSFSGPAFSNAVMAVGPIEHGTVKSVPGYGAEPFEGEVVNGADIFQVDALFRSVKLDFRAVIKYAISFSFCSV